MIRVDVQVVELRGTRRPDSVFILERFPTDRTLIRWKTCNRRQSTIPLTVRQSAVFLTPQVSESLRSPSSKQKINTAHDEGHR